MNLAADCACLSKPAPGGELVLFSPACPVHGGSGLTGPQRRVLTAIERRASERYVPTLRELCAAMGYASTNAIADVLDALERKGCIERGDRRASRAIRVVPLIAAIRSRPAVPTALSS